MRHAPYESVLNRNIYRWHYETRRLDTVDRKASLDNQARFKPIMPFLVERYIQAMKRGDVFPAPVLYHPPSRTLAKVVTGNHRAEAARALRIKSLDCYIIDEELDEAAFRALANELNLVEGFGSTEDENRETALWEIQNQGLTVKAASEKFLIKEDLLAQLVRQQKAIARLHRVERGAVVEDKRLTITSMERLNSIHDDDVFQAATDLCVGGRIAGEKLDALTKDLNALRTVGQQLALIQQWSQRDDIIESKRWGKHKPVAVRYRRQLRTTIETLEDLLTHLAGIGLPAAELAALGQRTAVCGQTILLAAQQLDQAA